MVHPYRDAVAPEAVLLARRVRDDGARPAIASLVVALVAGLGVFAQPSGPVDRWIGAAVALATSVALGRILRGPSRRMLDERDVRT